ncbi:MAG: SDR family NAD(P)-dependent oxidoreductase [Halanaerobiales bacterium]
MKLKAYVTGADRGLGLALTEVLLKNNYKVYAGSYLSDWNALDDLKKEYGDSLEIISLDVTEEQSVEEAAKIVKKDTDILDVLINNAGIIMNRSGNILEDLYFEDMRKMYEVNTLGPLKVTHSVIDILIKSDKKLLINISSEAGSIGDCWREKEFGYSMSKSALNMQSAILHNHLKRYGVKVLALHPGWLKSYMLGEKNMEANIEPDVSAESIYRLFIASDISKRNTENNQDIEGQNKSVNTGNKDNIESIENKENKSFKEEELAIYYDYLGNRLPW